MRVGAGRQGWRGVTVRICQFRADHISHRTTRPHDAPSGRVIRVGGAFRSKYGKFAQTTFPTTRPARKMRVGAGRQGCRGIPVKIRQIRADHISHRPTRPQDARRGGSSGLAGHSGQNTAISRRPQFPRPDPPQGYLKVAQDIASQLVLSLRAVFWAKQSSNVGATDCFGASFDRLRTPLATTEQMTLSKPRDPPLPASTTANLIV